MSYIHWVARQNKLELPNDEEEVNTRDIHKCDGQAHDPDTMAAPLTPKPTRKAEAPAKAPPTIVSRRKEDVALHTSSVTLDLAFFVKQKSRQGSWASSQNVLGGSGKRWNEEGAARRR